MRKTVAIAVMVVLLSTAYIWHSITRQDRPSAQTLPNTTKAEKQSHTTKKREPHKETTSTPNEQAPEHPERHMLRVTAAQCGDMNGSDWAPFFACNAEEPQSGMESLLNGS